MKISASQFFASGITILTYLFAYWSGAVEDVAFIQVLCAVFCVLFITQLLAMVVE